MVRDGDLLPQVGVILSGGLHLFHIDADGNNNLMEQLGQGDSLGILNAVGGYKLHISAETTEQTEILFLTVDQLLREHVLTAPVQIRFLQNLTLAAVQQAYRLTRKLEDSIRRSTRDRLQDYLSQQFHNAGSRKFSIPLNRQDLADFLFVDRSAMSNELTGINAWITSNITPLTSSVSPIVVVLIITTAGVLLTNFASNVSTITVMTGVGVSLALASSGAINPAGIALCTTMAGSCAYLLPSSFACIAMLHGNDWSDSKKVYIFGIVMMVASSLAIGLVGYSVGCALT